MILAAGSKLLADKKNSLHQSYHFNICLRYQITHKKQSPPHYRHHSAVSCGVLPLHCLDVSQQCLHQRPSGRRQTVRKAGRMGMKLRPPFAFTFMYHMPIKCTFKYTVSSNPHNQLMYFPGSTLLYVSVEEIKAQKAKELPLKSQTVSVPETNPQLWLLHLTLAFPWIFFSD